jgi:hypothetical protein
MHEYAFGNVAIKARVGVVTGRHRACSETNLAPSVTDEDEGFRDDAGSKCEAGHASRVAAGRRLPGR